MAAKPLPETSSSSKPKGSYAIIKYYLLAFNIVSTIGWAYVLVSTLVHLTNASSATAPAAKTAASTFSRLVASMPYLKHAAPLSAKVQSRVPSYLIPLWNRATSVYTRVGPDTALVQTLAVLEVFHAVFGWVRSPVQTTAMQVASRLFLVWGITEQFEVARTNPLYASMILAWSLTETIRYPFYVLNLLNYTPPYSFLWLRYSAFYILYPLGAGSEAALIYSTLPHSSPWPSWASWIQGMWRPTDYMRAGFLCIWPPGLYVMYTYMIKQRRKVLVPARGQGRTLGEKPKSQ